MKARPNISSDQALQQLMEGNQRYAASQLLHPHQSAERRTEVAQGQQPFAAVVGCSDSRVPPEIIFDRGLGDLFVTRLAGNLVDDLALGSLEYAVEHLGVCLIMVLGHKRCGAVAAAVEGGEAPGHIGHLLRAIEPAVMQVKNQPGDLLDRAIKINIARIVGRLRSSRPILGKMIDEGQLKIVGAYYNLDNGKVFILPCLSFMEIENITICLTPRSLSHSQSFHYPHWSETHLTDLHLH
jgi:carbonic anhydrase